MLFLRLKKMTIVEIELFRYNVCCFVNNNVITPVKICVKKVFGNNIVRVTIIEKRIYEDTTCCFKVNKLCAYIYVCACIYIYIYVS